MAELSPEVFLSMLVLIGAVIVIAALLSGLVERSGLPQVLVFLALGAAIGPFGLGMLDAGVNSPILRVVATLSLVRVLFTDAVSLDLREVREHKVLAALVLGPGTLLSALFMSLAGVWMLGLAWPAAVVLGAGLASTDPVLLRGLLKHPALPVRVRQALRLESGMNDVFLLPVVLVAVAVAKGGHALTGAEWAGLMVEMLLLSPGAGVVVALCGVSALEFARRRTGIRRDYESIYSLGIAFTAYAAAEAVHGSGFLAAFAAGLTVSALDVELCDCFLEYGETTAEMLLLFAFVLFGTSLIWSGAAVASPLTLGFAAVVMLLRPAAFLPALLPARISWRDRELIAWFGPKGLSSLLLVLLAVFANMPGSQEALTVCCLVVLCSVLVHGFSPQVVLRKQAPAGAAACSTVCELPVAGVADAAGGAEKLSGGEFIALEEVDRLQAGGTAVVVADSRTERTYLDSGMAIPGAVRLHPDHAALDAERQGIGKGAVIAVLCA